MWFNAWLVGFWELPTDKQRDFLFAVNAQVRLWREGEHQPSRAELRIGLPPEGAGVLPPPPIILEVEDARLAEARGYDEWRRGGGDFAFPARPPVAEQTAAEVMEDIRDELYDRDHSGDDDPPPDPPITFNSARRTSLDARTG